MNPTKNRQRGKDTERSLAKLLNAQRIGIMGKEDLSHPVFSYEVKSRKSFVALKWLEQSERNALKNNKTPVLVVHVNGKNHQKDLVILSLKSWRDLHVGASNVQDGL